MRLVVVATCNLNQWAMDFEGNLARIKASIIEAKRQGARLRLGPELETTGYSCEDHFLEEDTYVHSWDLIATILEDPDLTRDIIVDLGAPIQHRNVRYNCRVFLHNHKILLIRPKMNLANDGNYRETRWFAAWMGGYTLDEHYLPRRIREITRQSKAPFGIGAIATVDSVLASETCEELFTPQAPHITMALNGVEIILNGSGSHHQLRKLNQRVELIQSATRKAGGAYLYANHQGCDGNRLYFDGCSMIVVNGELMNMASQFSIKEVEVVSSVIDLHDIRAYRGAIASRSVQGASSATVPRVDVHFELSPDANRFIPPSVPIPVKYHTAEEEIAYGPACWLWDYLRRSGMFGYFLPLSGGADSSATCTLVGLMCEYVVQAIHDGNQQALDDVRRVTRDPSFTPKDRRELCNRLLYTCYMGSSYSSEETRDRAARLAEEMGANHRAVVIDEIIDAFSNVFMQQSKSGRRPDIRSKTENVAMQNIQARSRMVLSYFMAQLLPFDQTGTPWASLLVLGSANVDEALRGYYTKYDCSAADVNPIGGISKVDLKTFLMWCYNTKGWAVHKDVVEATPTAELQPLSEAGEVTQTDETEMGMSYQELSVYGKLRSYKRHGPVSMFETLVHKWGPKGDHPSGRGFSPLEIAEKVKHFFKSYAINRHKMTTLTPSYHAENYSPDDNRFDLRPFLYRVSWPFQFARIDEIVDRLDAHNKKHSNL
eukprot:Sspe_Gene.35476::Locus_17178_Transcript_1_1_Confidence_1.000_Length_2364::g.35476::m.35476/K01950/E6.3.5.1, NADSYN1, QNS1, nadE; NAD+ synthase (glutamine-hydrolysing)